MQLQILKTKKDKEEFLENDLIDRLIRVEQKVSAKFGKLIKYNDTYCYKNLTLENRKRYEKYLKTKKKKKFVFASIFFIPLFGVIFLSNNLTGNVVAEQVGIRFYNSFQIFFFGFLIGTIFFFVIYKIANYQKKESFKPLFEPLEKLKKKNF